MWLHSNWIIFIFFTSSLFGVEGFYFHVKGGLVIELFFCVFLKNGLGFASRMAFGSLAMLVPGGICEQFPFCSKFWELYGLLWCGSL